MKNEKCVAHGGYDGASDSAFHDRVTSAAGRALRPARRDVGDRWRTPTAFHLSAQGWPRQRATLGLHAARSLNPERVASARLSSSTRHGCNPFRAPFRVGRAAGVDPGWALARQPWAD